MIIGFLVGAILYGSVTLVFLIFLTADPVDDFQATHVRLTKVFFASLFWPVSVLVMAALALPSRLAALPRMPVTQRESGSGRVLPQTRSAA